MTNAATNKTPRPVVDIIQGQPDEHLLFMTDEDPDYTLTLHKTPIQKIISLPVNKSRYTLDPVEQRYWAAVGNLTAYFQVFEDQLKVMSTPAKKLLLFSLWVLTMTNHTGKLKQGKMIESDSERRARRTIVFPMDDFQRSQGKKVGHLSKGEIENRRKRILEALDVIYRLSLEWRDPKTKRSLSTRVLSQKGGIHDKYVFMVFTEEFMDFICNSPTFLHVPRELYRIEDRNPNALSMCLKMAQHFSMDSNRRNNQRRVDDMAAFAHKQGHDMTAEDIDREIRTQKLSVPVLLEACCDIKSYEEVKRDDKGRVRRKIMEPFFAALDTLVDMPTPYLTEWTLWKPNDEPLTDAELAKLDWETFNSCNVRYTVKKDLPDQTARLQEKERRKQRKYKNEVKNTRPTTTRGRKPKSAA